MKSPNKHLTLKSLIVLLGMSGYLGACQNGEADGQDAASTEDSATSSVAEVDSTQPEETTVDIRISAVGDIMMHTGQIDGGYDAQTDSYDFTPVFEHVKPIIQEADLAMANLETTLAGPELPYAGYPLFNAPDEVADALLDTGFDTIVTANNHSLDTRSDGLKRTVQVLNEKSLEAVGTYNEAPDSRVLLKNVEGVEIAIIGYTEMANGLEAQYSTEELDSMINLMSEEQILADIEEAKEMDPDMILAFMHWGNEYAAEPSDVQTQYAEMMTREGVDIILGSHPHVIQRSEFLEAGENEALVVYSMGNFVSNQRRESLGEGFEPTEDGVIVNLNIQKDVETGETTLQSVEFVPTWVHRTPGESGSGYQYQILPIESSLETLELPEETVNRMKQSYERTHSRLESATLQNN
ncbi:CapA family protein [Atopococcus tabaci]|uniref:CapA family protein n=1 Tax=Atopococcus tabaci TaxID=269774 RepID=UPI000406646D|nr:CapA family protein [Atopococcus tabaci]